jgi:hypothetical protein
MLLVMNGKRDDVDIYTSLSLSPYFSSLLDFLSSRINGRKYVRVMGQK